MTRTKWFLLGFALILLCALILVFIPSLIKSIQLASIPHPPNVPESWRPHDGGTGIFQVWLPRGWKDIEKGRIGLGSYLHAVGSDEEEYGTINVWNDDSTFERNAPLVGKELAHKYSSEHPVSSTLDSPTLDFDGTPWIPTNVVIIEREDDGINIAYQSEVLVREANRDLVGTVAFVVSEKHFFIIYLDTYEDINGNGPTLYEQILNAFYVTD